jgi:hypothetical protein
MTLTIVIQDHEQNPICVDMDIRVSTSLGSIDHEHINTENGQAIVLFIASDIPGMAKISVWHKDQLLAEDTLEMIAGPPTQLSFTKPPHETRVDDASALIKIQIQDELEHPATIVDQLRIQLSSTSEQSGQFWSWTGFGYSWMENESIAIVTQDNNPFMIKFKSSESGIYALTASDTSGSLGSDSQVITVNVQPPATIYGGILPGQKGKQVVLEITDEDSGEKSLEKLTTASSGIFTNSEWLSTFGIGKYSHSASWPSMSCWGGVCDCVICN